VQRRVRGQRLRGEACRLTFEFTRVRKRAKPAVARQVERRVSLQCFLTKEWSDRHSSFQESGSVTALEMGMPDLVAGANLHLTAIARDSWSKISKPLDFCTEASLTSPVGAT